MRSNGHLTPSHTQSPTLFIQLLHARQQPRARIRAVPQVAAGLIHTAQQRVGRPVPVDEPVVL